jgi:hypothetical protein
MRRTVRVLAVATALWLVPTVSTLAQQAPAPLPTSPDFAITLGVAHLGWADDVVASSAGPSLGFERRLLGPTAISAGVATMSAAVEGERARHYVLDLALRLAPPLARGRVTPYLGLGLGTTITDPAADSLLTRSQNMWEWMGGVDAAVVGPLTAGIQFRRLQVTRQELGTTPSGTATSTGVTWLEARLGFRF